LKPADDPDSALSFTMEGLRPLPTTNVIPFFWSPGWNSVQSVNKYQEEVGGALRAGDPGVRLISPSNKASEYYSSIPNAFVSSQQTLLTVPLHHIFGSEELSTKAPAVSKRVPAAYVAVSKSDSERMSLQNGNEVEFTTGDRKLKLSVKIIGSLPDGVLGIPVGLPGVGFVEYLESIEIVKV
jgi:NADH-quinone oxidoreductase subunit G